VNARSDGGETPLHGVAEGITREMDEEDRDQGRIPPESAGDFLGTARLLVEKERRWTPRTSGKKLRCIEPPPTVTPMWLNCCLSTARTSMPRPTLAKRPYSRQGHESRERRRTASQARREGIAGA